MIEMSVEDLILTLITTAGLSVILTVFALGLIELRNSEKMYNKFEMLEMENELKMAHKEEIEKLKKEKEELYNFIRKELKIGELKTR